MALFGDTKQSDTDFGADFDAVPIPGERRVEYRKPAHLQAVCEIKDPPQRLDCTVLDISSSGAQLAFADGGAIPDVFKLYVTPLNMILSCRVMWRNENNMGVSYTATSDSHY